MIKKSNPHKWLGQGINEPIDLRELEKRAAARMDELTDLQDELNKRKKSTRKKL